MESTLIDAATQNGIFALLFVVMLIYVLKEKNKDKAESRERENKLHGLLEKFSEKYDLIIEQLDDLKNQIRR